MTLSKLSKLSITLVTALAGVAWAASTTSSPGIDCVTISGTINARADGEIENQGSTTATVSCPLARDSSSTRMSGKVIAFDRNATLNQDVCCKIVNRNATGLVIETPQQCSAGSSTSYQALTLAELGDQGASYSTFSIVCTLPPTVGTAYSRIQTFRGTQQ